MEITVHPNRYNTYANAYTYTNTHAHVYILIDTQHTHTGLSTLTHIRKTQASSYIYISTQMYLAVGNGVGIKSWTKLFAFQFVLMPFGKV